MLLQIIAIMGVNYLTADVVEMKYRDVISARGGFTYAVFRDLVKDVVLQFRKQAGRYYCLLSLQEGKPFTIAYQESYI